MKTPKPSKQLRAWLAVRPHICAWLDANNIPRNRVPAWAVPTIRDGKITTTLYSERDGKLCVNPKTDDVATETITVPLRTEPPAQLAAWLRGEVPYQ